MKFSTSYTAILEKIDEIDPIRYGKTRNFIDGTVTRLSPYISRGVISTRQVLQHTLSKGIDPNKVEKFIQELAWRDYWQQVWVALGDVINKDVRREQPDVANFKMPNAVANAQTGINAIDLAIEEFYESGYLHNHVRMYIASLACNIGGSHWKVPARWMYYHLLDGDWASNALSWQWVAGANAGKKYFANQENINKYCYSQQKNSYLDVPYESFERMSIPQVLKETSLPDLHTVLPEAMVPQLDPAKPTLIYNYYNLDPTWHEHEDVNRVLLIEPSHFEQYPVSQKCMDFMLDLSKNITGIQIYVGSFQTLISTFGLRDVRFKEHPLINYKGQEEPRDWMFSVTGYHRSFFAFWKKCKKELKTWTQPTLF